MAKLSLDMEYAVQESLSYTYTALEFKKRYLPILDLLNNDSISLFGYYYDQICKLVNQKSDNSLLNVRTVDQIIAILNKYKQNCQLAEKDKVGFVEEIIEKLQSRNRYIRDLSDEQKAKKEVNPKDFLMDLEMLEPYKHINEFKPIIEQLEQNKGKYLDEHGPLVNVDIQKKTIDEKPINEFVNKYKGHKWNDLSTSHTERLKAFGIEHIDLQDIAKIDTVGKFQSCCCELVLEKLYKHDDNGNKKKHRNLIGLSFDKVYDQINKEAKGSCDLSDKPATKDISTLLPFAIEKLTAYCNRNPKKSPYKKAIVKEVVLKLEQANEQLQKNN